MMVMNLIVVDVNVWCKICFIFLTKETFKPFLFLRKKNICGTVDAFVKHVF